jgi:5,10-methylenetetrahydromethanopterin reductase
MATAEPSVSAHSLVASPTVGVLLPARASAASLPAFARRAETLGYTDLWVVEDCFLSGGLTLAATALACTSKLHVGIGLLPAAVRNAAIVSMEIATLAAIHPGRLTVAFGHGVDSWMSQIGARPRNRLNALDQTVSAVKTLLAGGTVTSSGELVELDTVTLDNPPATPPGILVGTTGPRALADASSSADGVLLPEGSGPRFIQQVATELRAGRPEGLAPAELVAYAWLGFRADGATDEALTEMVGSWREMGLYPAVMKAAGIEQQPATSPTPRSTIDEIAIAGDAQQCAAAARRMLAAGASRLVVAAAGGDYVEQYEQFAEHVLPLLRPIAGV